MKIKKILIAEKVLHFPEPFVIAYETANEEKVFVLKLIDDNNFFGLGSASIDTVITGETYNNVLNFLKKKLTIDFFSQPLSDWYYYHLKIQKVFKNYPSLQATVEEALLNLLAHQQNLPIQDFFGYYRQSCPIVGTVFIGSKRHTIIKAKKLVKLGFKIIKLKCGLDQQKDLERIIAVRKILPSKIKITLDANQGYKFSQAQALIKDLAKYNIELFEQPVLAKDWASLKKLHHLNIMPVIADESAVTVQDAEKLLKKDYVSGVNIKLFKCGGPINFLKIFFMAKKLKKIIMLGCMSECNISITTGASLALALPIDYVDLDSGNFRFPDDPASGGAQVKKGCISIKQPLVMKNIF